MVLICWEKMWYADVAKVGRYSIKRDPGRDGLYRLYLNGASLNHDASSLAAAKRAVEDRIRTAINIGTMKDGR